MRPRRRASAGGVPGPDVLAQSAPDASRDIVGEPLRRLGAGAGRAARQRVARDADAGRPAARRRRPLPARVLRRPAPAHRDRARARRRAARRRLRRGDLGARRVGAGADPQPARRSAGDSSSLARRVHLAQSRRRAPRQPPRGGDVSRPRRRDRAGAGDLRPARRIPIRGRCSRPCPSPIARRSPSRRRSPARCRARSTRRAAAISIRAVRGRRRAAAPRIPRSIALGADHAARCFFPGDDR